MATSKVEVAALKIKKHELDKDDVNGLRQINKDIERAENGWDSAQQGLNLSQEGLKIALSALSKLQEILNSLLAGWFSHIIFLSSLFDLYIYIIYMFL